MHKFKFASVFNVGIMQGKVKEAKPLYEESVAIFKKAYGDTHPHVGSTLNNLAVAMSDMVKY